MQDDKKKLGTAPYVVGGLSFVPLIGVIFGVISIVWGLTTKKTGGRTLVWLGSCGIAFTVIIYSALFYLGFVQRGGMFDDLRAQLAQHSITTLVQSIEFYKTQNGTYPASLKVLSQSLPEGSLTNIYDPMGDSMSGDSRYYHYELVGDDHYFLLAVGTDGVPFTSDDIIPKIEIGPKSKIGLLVKKQ